MLSGSAVLRVSLLLIAAGSLAALVQFYRPQSGGESTPAPRGTAPARPMPTDPGRGEVRRVEPPPAAARPPAPAPPPMAETAPAPVPNPAPVPVPAPAPVPEMQPGDMARIAPPPRTAPPPPAAPPPAPDTAVTGGEAGEAVAEGANPRAVSLVDLNTGSLADLNRLRGGGAIGRAIIQRRPYNSVDQLLSKRVLSRATYERIRDQVTVQ
ncbi:helix-hairpin-helix domain-containing protein [Methylobacterium planeticum]|uniref:Helix-hairpin-helix domain-containing protein n=1 Tax=Methylobacterium planeticum TaxID=2615211 RepID=A0A6N6MMN4_9HYPH|nr:helix-hairpin-helix domain-containing protein [Methylobacterium planeticum]KAB1071620.1 helix-hairpin-helix domain-containing protein [Methylobacterium planeticum]